MQALAVGNCLTISLPLACIGRFTHPLAPWSQLPEVEKAEKDEAPFQNSMQRKPAQLNFPETQPSLFSRLEYAPIDSFVAEVAAYSVLDDKARSLSAESVHTAEEKNASFGCLACEIRSLTNVVYTSLVAV